MSCEQNEHRSGHKVIILMRKKTWSNLNRCFSVCRSNLIFIGYIIQSPFQVSTILFYIHDLYFSLAQQGSLPNGIFLSPSRLNIELNSNSPKLT